MAGRAPGTFQPVAGVCTHAAQLYERDSDLVEAVRIHLAGGLSAGGAAIAIATEPHRREFATVIEAAGADMARFTSLDAAATLARFCRDGWIDREGFRRAIGGIVREAAAGGEPVRVYGEMVALLWDAGAVLAALELEELWTDLARELEFSLLCGYHVDSVGEADAALQDVCRLHTSVETTGHFGAVRESPSAARDFIATALRRAGAAAETLFDAQLVVSELATNAVFHARSEFSVAIRISGPVVRIAVRDGSAARPVLLDPGPTRGSGRGIALIEGLASDWGIESAHSGKTVWAELRP